MGEPTSRPMSTATFRQAEPGGTTVRPRRVTYLRKSSGVACDRLAESARYLTATGLTGALVAPVIGSGAATSRKS